VQTRPTTHRFPDFVRWTLAAIERHRPDDPGATALRVLRREWPELAAEIEDTEDDPRRSLTRFWDRVAGEWDNL
jgi:hypothetical protein